MIIVRYFFKIYRFFQRLFGKKYAFYGYEEVGIAVLDKSVKQMGVIKRDKDNRPKT